MSLIDTGRLMLETLNTPEGFREVRTKFNSGAYGIFDRAAAFMYLNRTAFNGLMRYNLSGSFNTSYGHYKSPISQRLRSGNSCSGQKRAISFVNRSWTPYVLPD
jgi:site-specific DNA-adenine methylase